MIRRTHMVLSLAAVLSLGAAGVVGRLSAGLPQAARPAGHGGGHGWFPDELGLSAEQRQQMDAIWAGVRVEKDKGDRRRRELGDERDAAVRRLLTADQQAAYDKIYADCKAARAELEKDHERLFRYANEKSRNLLTPAQAQQWEAMQKQMRERHGGSPSGGPGSRPAGPPPA